MMVHAAGHMEGRLREERIWSRRRRWTVLNEIISVVEVLAVIDLVRCCPFLAFFSSVNPHIYAAFC